MAEWWTYVKFGPHPCPARGPWQSKREAKEAYHRFFDRYGSDAGTYVSAGMVRLAGPYRTRARARAADISDKRYSDA